MTTVNRVLGRAFDGVMAVLGPFPPVVGLALLSALTSVALLLLVRATSDQARIADVKRAIRAGLFEIRLFRDDPWAVLRAQGEILRHNLHYLRLSAVPLLWAFVPLIVLMAHLQTYYGYHGLDAGQSALVKVRLADRGQAGPASPGGPATPAGPALWLATPDGVRVETPMVWVPSLDEAAWRIRVTRPGDYDLVVHFEEHTVTKSLRATSRLVRRSPIRTEAAFLAQVLHPAEPPLPASAGLRAIEVSYPPRAFRVLGVDVHWMLLFVLFTLIFAFVLKNRFGVIL